MATQHPDNAFTPYWANKPFISTSKEVEECYRSFSDLDCDEYMWDWEGKFVDEAVVDRLYIKYFDYFLKHPLGKEKFLTFRIPNIQREGPARLSRAFIGLLSASYSAKELKLHFPPLFEVIHPMTTSAKQLLTIEKKFFEIATLAKKILEFKKLQPEHLDLIPLIEGTGTLLKSQKILSIFCSSIEKMIGHRPQMIRPFIARSDPALDGGFIAAVLSAKAALSEYYLFQKKTGIQVKPIIGVGSLRFRGGLSPDSIDEFLQTYPGISTVTLQSSFRYDHPLEETKQGILQLQKKLPLENPVLFSKSEMAQISRLDHIFVKYYRKTIEGTEPFINQIAKQIPQRRERLQHTGHFGYSRSIGKAGISLPRAITFTSVFYSLGIPPEFIGIGRGFRAATKEKLLPALEKFYPGYRKALLETGKYLNKENLDILGKKFPPFKFVKAGIGYLEEILGQKLGPNDNDSFLHRNYTSNVVQNWLTKKELEEDILKAAEVRKSLG
jgi:phosphoenolpyruvate carboxylase